MAVTAAALALWARGFNRYAMPLVDPAENCMRDSKAIEQPLILAISRTARILPWSSCLTRSCALTSALRQRGKNARMHIGVARLANALQAHAWVELDGQPIGMDGEQATGMARLFGQTTPLTEQHHA